MRDAKATALITPETKVGALLADFPQLEEVLFEISPTYQALKNPVLRRTAAKVATLRQVAKVGGIPLGVLIGRLRRAVGQDGAAVDDDETGPHGLPPDWARNAEVARSFDAREAIESGGHPMERVMGDLATLEAGEIYELVTPFVPAPLVGLARQKGFEGFSIEDGAGLFRTRFRRF